MARHLSDDEWLIIRAEREATGASFADLGERHGVSHTAVRKKSIAQNWSDGRDHKENELSLLDQQKSGFIYVLYIQDTAGKRFCKIGMSRTFHNRSKELQTGCPFEIKIACVYMAANMKVEETILHDMFAEKRGIGEWFDLDDEDLKLIASRGLIHG